MKNVKKSKGEKVKRSTGRAISPATRDTALRPVQLTIAAFILLRNAAVYFTPEGLRSWGLDFAGYLEPSLWREVLLWLPMFFVLPPVIRWIDGFARRSSGKQGSRKTEPLAPGSGKPFLIVFALAVAAAALSWWFPVAFAFLGDGTWYAAELYRSAAIEGYSSSIIKPTAFLTGTILDWMAAGFQPEDIRLPFRILGSAGAFIAVLSVLLAWRKERMSTILAVGASLLLASGSLMFFGYIELYALLYALCIAYVATAWQCFRAQLPSWIPGVLLLAAALFGITALVFLPSYLLLLHWKFRGEGGPIPLRSAAVMLAALPVLAVIAGYMMFGTASDNGYLVPLQAYERVFEGMNVGWQRYTMFTPARLADLVNVMLLNGGVSLALLAGLLVAGKSVRGDWNQPQLLFFIVMASSGILLLVAGNTFLGLARDWDVAAIAVLAITMLPVAIFVRRIDHGVTSTATSAMFLVAMASSFLLWQMTNVNERSSASRFTDIASMDAGIVLPMNTYTANENLRKFHKAGGETEAYFATLDRLLETGYEKEHTYAEYLSSVLSLKDQTGRSVQLTRLMDLLLDAADEKHPSDDFRHISQRRLREMTTSVMLTGVQVGAGAEVHRFSSEFQSRFASWPELDLYTILVDSELPAELILARARAAVDEETGEPFLLMFVGGLHQQHAQPRRAVSYYEKALALESALYPSWYLVLANLHLNALGKPELAKAALQRCISLAPGTDEARRAQQQLNELQTLSPK